MRKSTVLITMCIAAMTIYSCGGEGKKTDAVQKTNEWVVDKFDDTRILRYNVPHFEELSLEKKLYVYYLNQAALCGRDILFDQNGEYNLAIRRVLENIYENAKTDRENEQWTEFEIYLKKVWFANGIHHHYSMDKFNPGFTPEYMDALVELTPDASMPKEYGTTQELMEIIKPIIFDPNVMPVRINQAAGVDMLTTSAMNYYKGVTQKEAEQFYAKQASAVKTDRPVSYGLNSRLVKENGKLVEKVWKIGGTYSPAIERVVYWLEKAQEVANERQKPVIASLIKFYRTGDLKEYDNYNILWAQETESTVDFVNGFTETYGDPLGYKASWESIVNIKSEEGTKRTEVISDNAQWFEDNSPMEEKYKKKEVKGVSAKVINVTMLGGDCYPATPLGINLPNSDWIRKEHGSKSVTIENISAAYAESSKGNGFNEEFMLRQSDRDNLDKYGLLADNLHTDLHECLGHGSGQLAPGVKGDELKSYGATMEEARADLFALYYLGDEKMIELGIIPTLDVAWAEYAKYIMNGMMTQFSRVKLGKDVEQTHMRNRKLIAEWCYEAGRAENVIEKVVDNGKTYIVVNDFVKLRGLFGEMLKLIQSVKSEGNLAEAQRLIEKYSVKIDQELHSEVIIRYEALNIEPYAGFINPIYNTVIEDGEVVDVKIEYQKEYAKQMLDYSKNYSFLPSKN